MKATQINNATTDKNSYVYCSVSMRIKVKGGVFWRYDGSTAPPSAGHRKTLHSLAVPPETQRGAKERHCRASTPSNKKIERRDDLSLRCDDILRTLVAVLYFIMSRCIY